MFKYIYFRIACIWWVCYVRICPHKCGENICPRPFCTSIQNPHPNPMRATRSASGFSSVFDMTRRVQTTIYKLLLHKGHSVRIRIDRIPPLLLVAQLSSSSIVSARQSSIALVSSTTHRQCPPLRPDPRLRPRRRFAFQRHCNCPRWQCWQCWRCRRTAPNV